MISRVMAASTAALTLSLSAPVVALAAAPTAAQDPLTYEQYVSCTAIFYLLHQAEADPELKGAFKEASDIMLFRATPLGAARGLNRQAVLEAIADEIDDLESWASQVSGPARISRIRSHGPHVNVCLDEVTTSR